MLRPRTHDNSYFHVHPMHSLFSLIGSLVLAGLVILALTMTAR